MSVQTSTWASQPAPAPMPIVGTSELLGDPLGEVGRDRLEHDGEGAGVLQRQRVLDEGVAAPRRGPGPQAHDELGLRGEPDVAHDRHAGRDEQLDLRRDAAAALELDRVGADRLQEAHGGRERLLRGGLVGAERQVGDDHRPARRADHRAHHGQQLVDGDRDGRGVPEHVVAGRVADEQHRDAGRLEDRCGEHVVRRQHRPPLTAVLGALQVARADAAVRDAAVEAGRSIAGEPEGAEVGRGADADTACSGMGTASVVTQGQPPRLGAAVPGPLQSDTDRACVVWDGSRARRTGTVASHKCRPYRCGTPP